MLSNGVPGWAVRYARTTWLATLEAERPGGGSNSSRAPTFAGVAGRSRSRKARSSSAICRFMPARVCDIRNAGRHVPGARLGSIATGSDP